MKKLVGISLCIMTLALGAEDQEKSKKANEPVNFPESVYNWSRTMAEVFNIADQKHYRIAGPDRCMIQAIDAFLSGLDPHSSFFDPETYKNLLEMTSGEFFGIGVVIDNTRQTKDKFLIIIDTIPEGPADKAGVKPLDKIIAINGESIDGVSTDKVTAKLRGERHTKVSITVMREQQAEPLSFEISRDVIKEQNSVCFYVKDQDVFYLSLNMFTENSAKQIAELLKKTVQKKSKGLILDLRNNTGGLLNVAIDIAGLFLERGSLVVTTKDKNNKKVEEYMTRRQPFANGAIPIFILINNYTASAAEILAGALKIHSESLAKSVGDNVQNQLMVFLVGTKTYGKGSVQEVIPISNNCAVKITTSLYYLPNDTTIQGSGIQPDFEIERKTPPSEHVLLINKMFGRESALTNYIKPYGAPEESVAEKAEKDKKRSKEKTWAERSREAFSLDNQIREAITLINFLHTAQQCCPQKVSTRQKAITFLKSNFLTDETLALEEIKI